MQNINFYFRLPARYFDPVTQLPYATLQAFRVLREAYYQQLEDKGDPNNKEVASWLAWRKQYKKSRASAQSIKPSVTPVQPQPAAAATPTPTLAQHILSSQTATPTATSVSAVAQILRTAAHSGSTLIGSTGSALIGGTGSTQPQVATTLQNGPRTSVIASQSAAGTASLAGLQGGTVQLVQTVGSRAMAGTVRPGSQMVVVTSAGTGGGLHLVGGTGGNLLVQGGTGGTANLLVQGVQTGQPNSVQIVQAGTGGGNVQVVQTGTAGNMQVVQAGAAGNMQVVPSSRITLRPVASQAFTNLQSLLK